MSDTAIENPLKFSSHSYSVQFSTVWQQESDDESDVVVERGQTTTERFDSRQCSRRSLKDLYECEPKEQQVFLEGQDIKVSIAGMERDTRGHPLNPNLYTIRLNHGDFIWTVKRRFKHFRALRSDLLLYKAQKGNRYQGRRLGHVPGLPFRPEMAVRHVTGQVSERRKQGLEAFLQGIVNNPGYRRHQQTLNFLEVSRFSFVHDLGTKTKEGVIKKKSGGRKFTKCRQCCNLCCYKCACGFWNKRWLLVKDTFVAYIHLQTREVSSVLLFDRDFSVKCGREETGIHHGLQIANQSRELLCQSWSYRQTREWFEAINDKMTSPAGCVWLKEHCNQSFAPVRDDTSCKWFVCGETYFEAVADALESAEQEIFIMDWWLTPEFYLKRKGELSLYWRLDEILKRKANQGVKVYVCLYKEVEAAVTIASLRAKQILQGLHSNILVLRHPDHDVVGGTFLWAHHEKIVCVDQCIAFVGGLDMCIGRWDNGDHCLTDVGEIHLPVQTLPDGGVTAAIAEPTAVLLATANLLSADNLEGSALTQSQALEFSMSGGTMHEKWVGQDYYNPFLRTGVDLDHPSEDMVDRRQYPRMPWQDIGACVLGQAARDVARHFVHRWNFIKTEKKKNLDNYPFLLPRDRLSPSDDELNSFRRLLGTSLYHCQTQVLRSCGEWSSGLPPEQSILNAYISLIEQAEHFIYIENQFFITSLTGSVGNEIGDALFKRIVRAHKEGKIFKVIVVCPLLPEFDGEIGEASGTAIQTVLHWNYHCMVRGGQSLMQRLQATVGNPSNYIMFFGLRKHDELKGKPVSEIVYVHSKLMIVDDKKAIIGSANINDRSMTGRRDSEIAVLVTDSEMIESKMNDQLYLVGKFSHSLRMQIFREHFGGVSDDEIADPLCDTVFKYTLVATAAKNTYIFEEVFNCMPCDSVKTFAEAKAKRLEKTLAQVDSAQARDKLKGVKGNAVLFPRSFLEAEDLLPKFGTAKESLIPSITFT
ncbi:phospholipase D1-like [Corticium candelabrum]|uniref:phospholipase D1-like n=1 Tax=Corticium candelabrum TaxID=121492 RepID=UPI002E25CC9D|nr:phospholipase D1-like [Corticium candelabrum]